MTVRANDPKGDPADARGDAVQPLIDGRIDAVEGTRVFGWAWARSHPDERLDVEAWVGNVRLGATRADRLRTDLRVNRVGDGGHAFELELERPLDEEEGRRLTLVARRPGGGEVLALRRRTDLEAAAEGAMVPAFQRIVLWTERILREQGELRNGQRAVLDAIRALEAGRAAPAGPDKEDPQAGLLLARVEEVQTRLDERAEAGDVWLMRLDALVKRIEAQAAETAAARRRGVGPALVVLLVLVALAAGIALGVGLRSGWV